MVWSFNVKTAATTGWMCCLYLLLARIRRKYLRTYDNGKMVASCHIRRQVTCIGNLISQIVVYSGQKSMRVERRRVKPRPTTWRLALSFSRRRRPCYSINHHPPSSPIIRHKYLCIYLFHVCWCSGAHKQDHKNNNFQEQKQYAISLRFPHPTHLDARPSLCFLASVAACAHNLQHNKINHKSFPLHCKSGTRTEHDTRQYKEPGGPKIKGLFVMPLYGVPFSLSLSC